MPNNITIKFDKFNEEMNFKKALAGAALGTSLMIGSPSCNNMDYNPSNPNNIERYDVDSHNFSKYQGKIIYNIRYGDGEARAGDYLIISFTDNTNIKLYAYKYNMKLGDEHGEDLKNVDFSIYKGKIINYIKYGDNEGNSGDLIYIYFTDKSKLVVYAYKYTMEIHK